MMEIVSINVGNKREISTKSGVTGIYKQPVATIQVNHLGLARDFIGDTENHGGVDQAVYVYTTDDYAWWENELGRGLPAGIFGENITLSGYESADFIIGDKLMMGEVVLQVTSARIPCVTLAARMDDPKFVKKFMQAKRFGAYCRVLETGTLQTGTSVALQKYDGVQIGIVELASDYNKQLTKDELEHFLSAPIDVRSRAYFEEKLSEID